MLVTPQLSTAAHGLVMFASILRLRVSVRHARTTLCSCVIIIVLTKAMYGSAFARWLIHLRRILSLPGGWNVCQKPFYFEQARAGTLEETDAERFVVNVTNTAKNKLEQEQFINSFIYHASHHPRRCWRQSIALEMNVRLVPALHG